MIFLNFDLSQAENRVVLMLTGDLAMVEIARTPPWERDMHSENAAEIFNVPLCEVTKQQRHLGKIVSHGAQRNMHGATLSDNILKELGIYISPGECERFITRYMQKYAPLKHYFKSIRLQVVKHRVLMNTWGRRLYFTHDHLDDDAVFREAYSFLPQSEVADLLNQRGFKPLFYELKRQGGPAAICGRINVQVHDSVLVSCPPDVAWYIAQFVREKLERPRTYLGNELTIPVDFSLGSTWDLSHEFKKPPTQAEFEAAAWECERRGHDQRDKSAVCG